MVDGSDGRAGTIPEPKWIEQFQVQVTIPITIVVVEYTIRPGALYLYHHCMSTCDASTSHVEVLMSDVVGSKDVFCLHLTLTRSLSRLLQDQHVCKSTREHFHASGVCPAAKLGRTRSPVAASNITNAFTAKSVPALAAFPPHECRDTTKECDLGLVEECIQSTIYHNFIIQWERERKDPRHTR